MKKINDVLYNDKPQKVSVYPSSVYVCESCEAVEIQIPVKGGEKKPITKYKCQMTIYEIPEYIDKLQQENEALNAQTTELQLALCEVYEMML